MSDKDKLLEELKIRIDGLEKNLSDISSQLEELRLIVDNDSDSDIITSQSKNDTLSLKERPGAPVVKVLDSKERTAKANKMLKKYSNLNGYER